jgi:hypothetical protein
MMQQQAGTKGAIAETSTQISLSTFFCQQEKLKRFEGVCPKCGTTGPKRESDQKALRA